MSGIRRHRRADGTLRPTYRRYRQRKQAAREEERNKTPERQAWLGEFKPGARDKFFKLARWERAVWLRKFHAGLVAAAEEEGSEAPSELEASKALEELGFKRGWMKLRKADGFVVGIAAPRSKPSKKRRVVQLDGDASMHVSMSDDASAETMHALVNVGEAAAARLLAEPEEVAAP